MIVADGQRGAKHLRRPERRPLHKQGQRRKRRRDDGARKKGARQSAWITAVMESDADEGLAARPGARSSVVSFQRERSSRRRVTSWVCRAWPALWATSRP